MIIFSGWKTFAVLGAGAGLVWLLGEGTIALILAGILVAVAGFWVNSPKQAADGSLYKESNSLMFIPVQWWGLVIIGIAIWETMA